VASLALLLDLGSTLSSFFVIMFALSSLFGSEKTQTDVRKSMTALRTSSSTRSSGSDNNDMPRSVASGQYRLRRKIGSGAFGEVYSGRCALTGEEVAIKFESSKDDALEQEVAFLKALQQECLPPGFAALHHFGREGLYKVMVTELLGRSLTDVFESEGSMFNVQTTMLVAQQVLRSLEYVHSHGIIHRDIKPDNFMCGRSSKRHQVYMIDFGMATNCFVDGKHIPFDKVLGFSGNLRYASIDSHTFAAQSRRDDLQAVGHMLYFFLLGRLPWSGLSARNWRDQNLKVMEKKINTPVHVLNAGQPKAFEDYLKYCRALAFEAKPNYNFLRGLFSKLRRQMEKESGKPIRDVDVQWLQESERRSCRSDQQLRESLQHPDDTRVSLLLQKASLPLPRVGRPSFSCVSLPDGGQCLPTRASVLESSQFDLATQCLPKLADFQSARRGCVF